MRIYRIYIILFCFLLVQSLGAQTVKDITVSQKESYTDHISMEEDTQDKDLMVKFVFDEAANTLTVSLISYRTIFVFREDVRYKPLIKGRTIRPDQLPYVVTFDPKEKYQISKLFKSTVPRPRKQYVFSRWIEYDGLQPAPQEYSMVNDYISQTFDILNKRSMVTVTLRDIMLMDDISKSPAKKRYEIPYGRDLFREYHIRIDRDPCFGLDEDIAAAQNARESVIKGYASIKDKYGSGVVSTKESLNVFDELKDMLMKQFPAKDIQTACPTAQEAWDDYNAYVDSIAGMKCTFKDPDAQGGGGGGISGEGVNAKLLLNKARQLDTSVARWLLTTDPVERRDITQKCDGIIKGINQSVTELGVYTAEQKNALAVFRRAERYYRLKCH